jgi:hypothetical protein
LQKTDKIYINQPGHEVPENKILLIPFPNRDEQIERHKEVLVSLKGNTQREWFNPHFYYCLPIVIGNQYGFAVKSYHTFDAVWDGSKYNPSDISVTIYNDDNSDMQTVQGGFSEGVLTIQNKFHLKTPPGVNLMTIQPPNFYIPGLVAMTGVVETDNVRRDFSLNFKMTDPGRVVRVNKGDVIGAFMPIPRNFVENFELDDVHKYFSKELILNEQDDETELSRQRDNEDREKPHFSGRKYFKGEHAFGDKYINHQKRIV